MSVRRHITLLVTLAVGVAVALACGGTYVAIRAELRQAIDRSLAEQADVVGSVRRTPPDNLPRDLPVPRRGGRSDYGQRIDRDGRVLSRIPGSAVRLPVTAADRAVAAGRRDRHISDVRVDDARIRVLTFRFGDGALQVGRSLASTDTVLRNLRLVLVALCAAGMGLAALLGRSVGHRVVAPIRRVSATARTISETHDLTRRIAPGGGEEVAELAAELRTPVTTLRANIELLESSAGFDDAERGELVGELREQVHELGELVADVIELARGSEPAGGIEDVLDNAAKHAGDGRVDVRVHPGGVDVRDHGDGIPEADVPYVFDRFYRSTAARGRPGTGLGLAIVKQVAEAHGGRVHACNAPGGGALVRLELPGRAFCPATRAHLHDPLV